MVLLNELRDVAIRVLNDLLNMQVDLLCVHRLVHDQSVNLVQDQHSLDLGLPGLPDHSSGLG